MVFSVVVTTTTVPSPLKVAVELDVLLLELLPVGLPLASLVELLELEDELFFVLTGVDPWEPAETQEVTPPTLIKLLPWLMQLASGVKAVFLVAAEHAVPVPLPY